MAAAPISSSSFVTHVPANYIPELDEKSAAAESPAVQFNAEALCNAIMIGLKAEEIADTTPTVLTQISECTQSQFMQILETHITQAAYDSDLRSQINETALILYSISLRNSRFNGITTELNKNIVSFVDLSKKENFQQLIDRANLLLSLKPTEDSEVNQKQGAEILQLTTEINSLLGLYFYLDPTNKDRIENLYTYAKSYIGEYAFPNCRQHFQRLCQHLGICQNERRELSQLQRDLLQRGLQIKEKCKDLSTNPALLSSEREQFYRTYDVDFWQAGTELLETSFKDTFNEKRLRNTYLPETLHAAIKQASKIDGCKHLTFNHLLKNFDKLPEQYLSAVWLNYLSPQNPITDIADTMRCILRKIPDEEFSQLKTDVKTSPAQDRKLIIQNSVSRFLKSSIRNGVTFPALKQWIESHRH